MLKARYEDVPISEHPDHFFELPDSQTGRSRWKDKHVMWNSFLGIRNNLPDEFREDFIMDFLINEYGAMTFSEIELAFKMNMLGEFGTVIEHYNELNVKFLSQIVNAYKVKRIEVDKKYKEICHTMQFLPPPIDDPRERDYHAGKHVYLKYKQWLLEQPVIALFSDYQFLQRIGIIETDPAQMDEAVSMISQDIGREMEETVSSGYIGALVMKSEAFKDENELNGEVTRRAKEYIVKSLFEKIKNENIDFQQLIREHISTTHTQPQGGTNTE